MAMEVPIPVCNEILLPEIKDIYDRSHVITSIIHVVKKMPRFEVIILPKTKIEKPITKTRFNTFPTACVRGATLSRVLVAS